jgi:hypothetical protein
MDESLFANPPEGAVIDYFLPADSASPIQLEVLDANGKSVRRFSSADKLHRTDPNSIPFPMQWVRDPRPLPTDPGMHRFVWDLHYSAPAENADSNFFNSGPLAVPGTYSIKFIVDGQTLVQPLTLKMDPRVNASGESLQAQFALASRLTTKFGEVAEALKQATSLSKQIAARKKDAEGNAELLALLNQLGQKTEGGGDSGYQDEFMLFGLALPEKEHQTLPKVAAALTGLFLITEGAAVSPTADVQAASKSWEAAADESLSRWKSVREHDLAAANASLQAAHLKPLTID